jgi:hypothetical protein
MSAILLGMACLVFFSIAEAVRNTFFGNVFQSVSFFVVAVPAFSASTVLFSTWALLCNRSELK